MSDGTRRFAVVAALAALVVAFRGTAQAAPTTYPIPNYNFGSPTAPDGQVKWPVPYWYPAVGDGGTGFGVWNPPASAFPTAGGNGALPGTAAGSQCYVNAATVWNNDVDICTATYDGSDAAAVATLSPNTRYTMTIAVGSPLTATVMDGQSLGFADINTAALIASHEDMYPNGWYKNGLNNGGVQYMTGFKGWGDFGDISYSISASSFIGTAGVKSGDGVILILGTGAGVCWSNVRLISQNWSPLFAAGNVTWDNNTTSAWSAKSGGPYGGKWAPGQDAVFEGGGGTVTVVESIASVNSLNFTTDCTAIRARRPAIHGSPATHWRPRFDHPDRRCRHHRGGRHGQHEQRGGGTALIVARSAAARACIRPARQPHSHRRQYLHGWHDRGRRNAPDRQRRHHGQHPGQCDQPGQPRLQLLELGFAHGEHLQRRHLEYRQRRHPRQRHHHLHRQQHLYRRYHDPCRQHVAGRQQHHHRRHRRRRRQ